MNRPVLRVIGNEVVGESASFFYIADLDAILGRGNNFDLCRELAHAFPDTALWIDAGFSDVTDCAFWLPLGATLVIGSESVASLEAWDNIRASFGRNVVLYWREMAAKQSVELPISLIAAIPGTYTGPASQSYLYYTDEHRQWASPLKVQIEPRAEAK